MKLKNGKFYDDAGNVVPLEHGNKEQIAILEKHRKRMEAFEGDGLDLTITIATKASVSFACVCGEAYLNMDNEDEGEVSAQEGLIGQVDTCYKCKRSYEIKEDQYGDPVAKFK